MKVRVSHLDAQGIEHNEVGVAVAVGEWGSGGVGSWAEINIRLEEVWMDRRNAPHTSLISNNKIITPTAVCLI